MSDGYYGEEDYGCEFGEVRDEELSLGRAIPPDLRHYLESQGHLPRARTVLDQLPLLAPETSAVAEKEKRTRTAADLPTSDTVSRIVLPPGSRLSGALRFLLSPAWYRTRIEPVIADMQEEYFQELKAGHRAHAWWIVTRGHLCALETLLRGAVDAIYRLLSLSK